MTTFLPKKWNVRFLADFDVLGCTSLADSGISMEAFMAVKPAGGREGSFRLVLTGPEKIKLRFNIDDVLPSGLFAGMVAEAEVDVGENIQIKGNSVSSVWQDLGELVQSQDITVQDGLGEDVGDEFVAALKSYREDMVQETGQNERAGISFRWLIGTLKDDNKLLLLAQVT